MMRPRPVGAFGEDDAGADGGPQLCLDEGVKLERDRGLPLGLQGLLPPRWGVDRPALTAAAGASATVVPSIHRAS